MSTNAPPLMDIHLGHTLRFTSRLRVKRVQHTFIVGGFYFARGKRAYNCVGGPRSSGSMINYVVHKKLKWMNVFCSLCNCECLDRVL